MQAGRLEIRAQRVHQCRRLTVKELITLTASTKIDLDHVAHLITPAPIGFRIASKRHGTANCSNAALLREPAELKKAFSQSD
jgi:hypothetical protein